MEPAFEPKSCLGACTLGHLPALLPNVSKHLMGTRVIDVLRQSVCQKDKHGDAGKVRYLTPLLLI